MAIVQKTIPDTDSASPVPSPVRQGGLRAASSRSLTANLHVRTDAGQILPCRRRNGDWCNFVIPSRTSRLFLERTEEAGGRTVRELVFFMGAQERSLPLPAAFGPEALAAGAEGTQSIALDLPAFPHWVGALLCVRLSRAEPEDTAEQAA